jgi:hypothetical protein
MEGRSRSSSANRPLSLSLSREGRGDLMSSDISRLHHHPIHPYRFSDVLDLLFPQILIAKRHFVLDLIVYRSRNTNPTRLGQPLQPCGDVNAVTIEPCAFDDHIAHVEADAIVHLALVGQLQVSTL